jgi:hypothetical protein
MTISHQKTMLGTYVYETRYGKLGNVTSKNDDGILVKFEDNTSRYYQHNCDIYYSLESKEYVKNLDVTMAELKNSYPRNW